MSNKSSKPVPDDYRRILALLAASPFGCTEAMLLAQGIDQDLLVELARDGFATVREEPTRLGERPVTAFRLRITDSGRQALTLLKGEYDRHARVLPHGHSGSERGGKAHEAGTASDPETKGMKAAKAKATKPDVAANLTPQDRVILFCAATGIDYSAVGILSRAMQAMTIRGLIERDAGGGYVLTYTGRAAFAALLERAGLKPR